MIVVVLVTERQGIDSLPDQVLERVLNGLRIAVMDKLPDQTLNDVRPSFHLA